VNLLFISSVLLQAEPAVAAHPKISGMIHASPEE
jgi:hypothetical protein